MTLFAPVEAWLSGLKKLPLKTPLPLGVLALVALSQLGAVAGAVAGVVWLFALSVVVGVLVDQMAERIDLIRLLLERSQLGLVTRAMIREFAFVVLLARLSWPDPDVLLAATMTFVVIIGRAAAASADRQSTALQMPKIATRNLSISVVEESMPVSAVALPSLVFASALPLLVGVVGLTVGTIWPFVITAALVALVAAGWTVWRLGTLVQHRRTTDPVAVMQAASDAVATMRPEVVLYFSGSADAVYQINTWLRVMEQLNRRVLIVMRERDNLDLLAPTTLPVVCIPGASDLMDFRLPTVRVAFYVAHVGKNIHLQREPRMKHVFIGHGESDKIASVNPVTKVFDEVWVAGRVSRLRWAAAKVGVRDDAIVEVGRPQLGGIRRAEPRPDDRPLSVLYAPTWEGWTNDPFTSSLTTMGPSLVGWLLKRPNTRVIYKPHPFTGSVSPAARRAHAQVMGLLQKDARFGTVTVTGGVVTDEAWAEAQDRHLIVSGAAPTLYDCFNHSDMLIGDISSVVPDYVASGKPYLIPNPGERDHDTLREEYASLRAAYLLDPPSSGWAEVFDAASGPDPMLATREQLRLDLLGPYYEDPVQPWREALTSLIDRANAEWPDAEREAARIDD